MHRVCTFPWSTWPIVPAKVSYSKKRQGLAGGSHTNIDVRLGPLEGGGISSGSIDEGICTQRVLQGTGMTLLQ
jgi:hypothetical protein